MQNTTTPIDLNAIDAHARALRAQAINASFRRLSLWVTGLFAAGQGAASKA